MAQQIIFLGTNPNDGTGESAHAGGAKINNNFTELYALQSDTINAGAVQYNFAGATNEQRIALADADAVLLGKSRLYLPAALLPYDITLCPASPGVQRVREGGDFNSYDVLAYGAVGDLVHDDTAAIQAAITAAATNTTFGLLGGVVYLPPGRYQVLSTIVVPQAINQGQVILRGAGMRVTYVFAVGDAANFATGIIRFGVTTPDASGTSTNITQFCGMEDMSVKGSSITGAGSAVGVRFVEMQRGWMRNVIIESMLTGSSIGLHLLGSTTTGLGAAAAPHCWRCAFYSVTVTTSIRPLVLQNADENDFVNCNFGLPLGMTTPVIAVEWIQGQANHFFGTTLSGSIDLGFRANYTGLKLDAPVNGSCLDLMMFGLWAEGFDVGVLLGGGNGQDVWITGYHSAINRAAYNNGSDDGTGTEERKNNVHIRLGGSTQASGVRDYDSGPNTASRPAQLTQNSTTPSISGSSVFTCNNTVPTTITQFLNGQQGAPLAVRLDANTSIAHGTGPDNIRCPGAATVTAAAHKMVTLVAIGGLWYVTAVSTDA